MTRADIFDTIAELRSAGRPFSVATVVRTADVTSAKAGAKAAITTAGEILGHLGGACVQGAARKAAAEALATGEPRLIRVKPAATVVSLHDADGVRLYKSGCPSGGTVDILIEPYRLPPRLVIFGDTPIARAVAEHGTLLGWRVAMEEGSAHAPAGVARFAASAIGAFGLDDGDFVLVASQGKGDAAALRAAVTSAAGHVAMVASRRKAAALTARLATEGVPAAALDRLKSPAGLDLGAIDPQEIAVSVVAEMIGWRNAARARDGDAEAGQA